MHSEGSLGFNYSADAAYYNHQKYVFTPCLKCVLTLNAQAAADASQSVQFVSASSNIILTSVSSTESSEKMEQLEQHHWIVEGASSLASMLSPVAHVAQTFPQCKEQHYTFLKRCDIYFVIDIGVVSCYAK
jgi:hypothetical protein